MAEKVRQVKRNRLLKIYYEKPVVDIFAGVMIAYTNGVHIVPIVYGNKLIVKGRY